MDAPVLINPIPPQIINEQAALSPIDLKNYIQSTSGPETLHFEAGLADDHALPRGLICTSDGILTGIPAKGTEGLYEVVLNISNEGGQLEARFNLTIKPSLLISSDSYINKLKAQIWQALEQHLPVPDLDELINRPVTAQDVYYLLERWGVLTAWDAFNLEPAGEKVLLDLKGTSPHYYVYDRGSCLVACPKDIFCQERTLADGVQTAQAVAKEVFDRGWTVELVGFDKLVRAAWIECQLLSDRFGKHIEVINYSPTSDDIKLYHEKDSQRRMNDNP